tara:strand:- start:1026 stop:1322 length:297 start_codon:yes stop_codon:yes gene_type:complete
MKITKSRLQKIIKEELLKEAHGAGPDPEGRMAKKQLIKVIEYSQALLEMMDDNDQLEAWVQSILTKASSNMSKVYHHLHGEAVLDNRQMTNHHGGVQE